MKTAADHLVSGGCFRHDGTKCVFSFIGSKMAVQTVGTHACVERDGWQNFLISVSCVRIILIGELKFWVRNDSLR